MEASAPAVEDVAEKEPAEKVKAASAAEGKGEETKAAIDPEAKEK